MKRHVLHDFTWAKLILRKHTSAVLAVRAVAALGGQSNVNGV